MAQLADKLIFFYQHLRIQDKLPPGVEVMNPHDQPEVKRITAAFFRKYFSDTRKRTLVIGINPGRFGAGITGINFTAPRQLRADCGIEHSLGNSSELSAEFIYEMIREYGGSEQFYRDYYISAVSPLGFVKQGKNLNYYDDKALQEALMPFIRDCLDKQLAFGLNTARCYCIGGEKNFKFFSALNERLKKDHHTYFKSIIPLPHPRFIMQYRRKQKEKFLDLYLQALRKK